jgi:hypothetical protein
MIPIIRAFDAKLEVIAGERAVVAKINTDAIDRYKTVIDPAGMGLDNYRKNPVVLVNHGEANDGMPVGRCAWIRYIKAERAIVAKTIFLEDEYSDGLFRMAQAGILNAYSVRICPDMKSCSSPTADEIKKRNDLAECYMMFRASDLAEYSIVNVPGNPEALALAVSRGLSLPERLMHDIGRRESGAGGDVGGLDSPPPIPPGPEPDLRLIGRTLAQATAARLQNLRRTLPARAREAARERLDLLRGKV